MSKDITETYADGTIVERAFNDAELQQQAADIAWDKAQADALAARTAAREALLDRLGITADEAQLLLGGM
jgi:hypothetical protein